MNLTVVTGWSPSGWLEYGRRFLETFDEYWPADVALRIYVEELGPQPACRRDVRQVLLDEISGCRAFIERHRESARANGRDVRPTWKESCRLAGYNYRFDAVKFSRQGFIPYHAAAELRAGLLCWLDGDVVSLRRVPPGFVEGLLPDDKACAYLGRGDKHSEIGFQLYRVPDALPMLRTFSAIYEADAVFDLPEWHSAYVFDIARKRSGIAALDLTPGGTGHVWMASPLRAFTDHLKGKRKKWGRSPERSSR
jgi:hypothetical protein